MIDEPMNDARPLDARGRRFRLGVRTGWVCVFALILVRALDTPTRAPAPIDVLNRAGFGFLVFTFATLAPLAWSRRGPASARIADADPRARSDRSAAFASGYFWVLAAIAILYAVASFVTIRVDIAMLGLLGVAAFVPVARMLLLERRSDR